jgi:hypothetical protein
MSAPDQPPRGPATFETQSLHVTRLPDENVATLTRFEFQVLRDGEVNAARAGRDLCLGFCVSAAIGLIGLLATIDWDVAFHQAHKAPFIWTELLAAIVFGSLFGMLIYQRRYKRTRENSAYSDLMTKFNQHFESQRPRG